ncbi:MAG TPA: hypothetical protein VH482_11055 [Thermomicrobiales bacterium]
MVAYGAEYPFKRKAGGALRRHQARADERRDQFARAVAGGSRQTLDEAGIGVLVIAGDEVTALKHVGVETLVMPDDFSASGGADCWADVPGVGPIPDQHPTGGNRGQIVPIRVEDEMIRRAVLTGAKIEIVRTDVAAPQVEDGVPKGGEPLPRR